MLWQRSKGSDDNDDNEEQEDNDYNDDNYDEDNEDDDNDEDDDQDAAAAAVADKNDDDDVMCVQMKLTKTDILKSLEEPSINYQPRHLLPVDEDRHRDRGTPMLLPLQQQLLPLRRQH